jgi:hypothetical protein
VSSGPSDTVLTLCDECGKYVEHTLLHVMRAHPTDEQLARDLPKRERENARNALRRGKRSQLRLDLGL